MSIESRQEAIDRIREYCSVYEDCTVCPQYEYDGETFVCKVIEKMTNELGGAN